MAKVSKTEVYPFDLAVTMLDYLLGTDANNNKKTKSYKVQQLADLFLTYVQENVEGLDQDNIFRFVNIPKFITTTQIQGQAIDEVEIFNGIDILFSYLNLTVTEKQLVIFKVKVFVRVLDENGDDIFRYIQNRKYYSTLGKGTYSPLSDHLTASKLEVDYIEAEARQTSPENIEGDVNNIVFDLGDITGENYLEYINTVPNVNYPSGYPLTDNTKIYYFKLQDSTVTYMYYFDEGNSANSYGYYGVEGDFIFTEPELILFYKSDYQFPIATTSQLTNNGADGTSTYVEHDELGTAATSNDYNDLDNTPDLSTKADLVGGVVPSYQLPGYVDDVIEVANYAALPVTGEGGKIYLIIDSNYQYRWSGSMYVLINTPGTIQKTITSNTILDDSFNNAIVKIKSNSTITIPSTLSPDFSCVFRTFTGATGTFVGGVGVTMDAQKGLILAPFKMATLFKDGATTTYVLEGELKT